MDVIPFIAKQPGLPDLHGEQLAHPEFVYASGPRLHESLQLMYREVLDGRDTMTVGEAFGVDFDQAPLFTDARRRELSMIFHFDIVRIDHDNWRKIDRTLPAVKATYTKIDRAAGAHGWNTSFLGNHDNPRAVSHFGDDSPQWRTRSAKALGTLILTQRATPFLYQGDELGMTNYPFSSIDEFDDVEVKGLWRTLVETGQVPGEELLRHLRQTSRDHSRTPMQWSTEPHAGFSTGRPWLAVNPNFDQINAASQVDDPDSVFNHYRRMIALRREHPALIHGSYLDIDPTHEQVFAYTRSWGAVTLLVLINLSGEEVQYEIPNGLTIGESLLTTTPDTPMSDSAGTVALSGWQATVCVAAGQGHQA